MMQATKEFDQYLGIVIGIVFAFFVVRWVIRVIYGLICYINEDEMKK
jgi:hypothetical protein